MEFTSLYPYTAYFVQCCGWIEVGYDDSGYEFSFIRALDLGGSIWTGQEKYESVDAAFADLEVALGHWMSKNGVVLEI